ncbi:Uu.00g124070.m01.CDS01 [Anthostomella pinea]|uniref:Uu.00g124070.m01.CDS01 n=1 Tax=Anthostomella pinea TaxID=933095 RepID=A0AAI8VHJ6_9PEZI|nr:Uu.00g124070.m01.CDS01 [Anthostomella pinea]
MADEATHTVMGNLANHEMDKANDTTLSAHYASPDESHSENCNATIVTDVTIYHCHKEDLRRASLYFRGDFRGGFVESRSGVVYLEDFDDSAVRYCIAYAHGGWAGAVSASRGFQKPLNLVLMEDLTKAYQVADYLLMHDLVDDILRFLENYFKPLGGLLKKRKGQASNIKLFQRQAAVVSDVALALLAVNATVREPVLWKIVLFFQRNQTYTAGLEGFRAILEEWPDMADNLWDWNLVPSQLDRRVRR